MKKIFFKVRVKIFRKNFRKKSFGFLEKYFPEKNVWKKNFRKKFSEKNFGKNFELELELDLDL